MKRYQVNFYPTNAEVEAEDENEAEVLALALMYDGELHIEVESVEQIGIIEED